MPAWARASLFLPLVASQDFFLSKAEADEPEDYFADAMAMLKKDPRIREAFQNPPPMRTKPPAVRNATQGWNILSDDFPHTDLLDGISFEWEYYMIHAEPVFTGIVGYVLMDPRGHLEGILPSGLNVAVAGKFGDGPSCDSPTPGTTCVMNYIPFWTNGTQLGPGPEGTMKARGESRSPKTAGAWATITAQPDPSGAKMVLEGSTADAEWSLTIEQGLKQRPPVAAQYIPDLGTLPAEEWTVHMVWPTTLVKGSMTNKVTGEVLSIDGHGYRENSFGRWLFALDGWDFAIFSDVEREGERGVAWQWQTYHRSTSGIADTVDVSFYDGDDLKSLHFSMPEGTVGWYHDDWSFSKASRQCVPRNVIVEAANEDYYIRADILMGESQIPLLSDATPVTGVYVINEWLPTVNGTITRQRDGSVVDTFQGVAGGEISFLRSLLGNHPVSFCKSWGKPRFARPLEHPVSKAAGGARHECGMQANLLACTSLALFKGCEWSIEHARCY